MNRKERRNLQRQGVQVPKDPTLNIKLSAEGHEALDAKVNTLIKVLKFIIAESGFELAARIELRDRKTGRFFR